MDRRGAPSRTPYSRATATRSLHNSRYNAPPTSSSLRSGNRGAPPRSTSGHVRHQQQQQQQRGLTPLTRGTTAAPAAAAAYPRLVRSVVYNAQQPSPDASAEARAETEANAEAAAAHADDEEQRQRTLQLLRLQHARRLQDPSAAVRESALLRSLQAAQPQRPPVRAAELDTRPSDAPRPPLPLSPRPSPVPGAANASIRNLLLPPPTPATTAATRVPPPGAAASAEMVGEAVLLQTEDDAKRLGIALPDAQCCICLEPFALQQTAWQTPCKHVFHGDCLQQWCAEHTTCPTCRARLLEAPLVGEPVAEDEGIGGMFAFQPVITTFDSLVSFAYDDDDMTGLGGGIDLQAMEAAVVLPAMQLMAALMQTGMAGGGGTAEFGLIA